MISANYPGKLSKLKDQSKISSLIGKNSIKKNLLILEKLIFKAFNLQFALCRISQELESFDCDKIYLTKSLISTSLNKTPN